MSLRLLAGPFDVVDQDGLQPYSLLGASLWYPGVGWLLDVYHNNGSGSYAQRDCSVMTLDGIYQSINQILQVANNLFGWWPERERMISGGSLFTPAPEYMYEPKTLGWQTVGPDLLYGEKLRLCPYIKLSDRRLFGSGFGVYANVDDEETLEYTLPFQGTARAGRGITDVFLHEHFFGEDVRFCFYNTVRKEIDSIIYHLGMPAIGLVYAPEYGVVVSLHRTGSGHPDPIQVRVWGLEVEPVLFSDVEVVGGAIHSGQIATFTVQLVGAQDEPCIGELIDWTIAGPGTLLDEQSRTNATGYAETRVLFGVTDTGTCTVTASVKC